jgi:hypothetical protein
VVRSVGDRGSLAAVVRALRGRLDQAITSVGGAATEVGRRWERGATALLFRTLVERFLVAKKLTRPDEPRALRAEHPWLFDPAADSLPRDLATAIIELATTDPLDDPVALGWAYQFWNDRTRAGIDARIGARGKVGATEIAEKTQLFTELYMVEWLLQNSLAPVVRALAERATRTGEPSRLGALVEAWPYVLVTGRVPDAEAPPELRELRLLDPACGTGHFLLGAFDLLAPLYYAEAADRGVAVDAAAIARAVLTENLWGGDIDNQAVGLAETLLALKARSFVAAAADAPVDGLDEALLPRGLVGLTLATDLHKQLDQLSEAARQTVHEWCIAGSLVDPSAWPASLRAELATLRPRGETTAPVAERLAELLRDGRYDVVCGNPPYLATAKIDLPEPTMTRLFGDQPDLSAAFFVRGLRLCKPTGLLAFVTPSNWMTLTTFRPLREHLRRARLRAVADLGKGAFRHASKLIQTAMVVVAPPDPAARPLELPRGISVAAPEGQEEPSAERLAGALKDKSLSFPFDPKLGRLIPGEPLLLGPAFEESFLCTYQASRKVGDVAEGAPGLATSDNHRFLRAIWEILPSQTRGALASPRDRFAPYVKGADGALFFEPFRWVLMVADGATELRLAAPRSKLDPRARGLGVAYTTIGHRFSARLHTVPSVRDVAGASFFPREGTTPAELLCALNRSVVKDLAHALNPTINFQIGDVRRLPFLPPPRSEAIVAAVRAAFEEWCQTQETSHLYRGPGPQRLLATARWAQARIDAADDAPWVEPPGPAENEAPTSNQWLSHAVGVILGRFAPPGAPLDPSVDGSVWREPPDADRAALSAESDTSSSVLPFFFVGPDDETPDSLQDPAAARLLETFAELAPGDSALDTPRRWLKEAFFPHHESLHQGRPVYFPFSSTKRSFVVFVWFHRLEADTLKHIVERALEPALAQLRQREPSAARERWITELTHFLATIEQLRSRGVPLPRAPRKKATKSAKNARSLAATGAAVPAAPAVPFVPFREDGTRVVAASLWPLLHPIWKAPATAWAELSAPSGKRHLDWSKTAAHHFPERIRQRAETDKSLAYAHRASLARQLPVDADDD